MLSSYYLSLKFIIPLFLQRLLRHGIGVFQIGRMYSFRKSPCAIVETAISALLAHFVGRLLYTALVVIIASRFYIIAIFDCVLIFMSFFVYTAGNAIPGNSHTGDLPTPIKYFNPEIKTAYKDLEKQASIRLLKMLPDELKEEYEKFVLPDVETEEYKLVKYADRLAAYLKCVEETRAGNAEFKKAQKSIGDELKKCGSKEVQYYLKEFAPAFELTLDELD